MPKHRKTPGGARADQRRDTDGGARTSERVTGPEAPPADAADAASERREQRWRTAHDGHWHNAGYSDETIRRQNEEP